MWLWVEFVAFYLGVPLMLACYPTRWDGHVCLWVFSIYTLYMLRGTRGFSWRNLWHGKEWPWRHKREAIIRFVCATAGVILFTCAMVPERLFSFPLKRPSVWVIVMILYPILSALPQELVFRSYFNRRFAVLFPGKTRMIAANAFLFGLIHVMFHNWVSPFLSLIAGGLFAWSYSQHRALKWAAIEHAAYGCMVFTIGIGFYFLVGALRS